KTTVSASLVAVWEGAVTAVDLDVEEPNLHLFLNPNIESSRRAYMEVPVVDEARCNYCGACADLCQFKAISVTDRIIMTFPEMCHGCGGCFAVCQEDALTPGKRELGEILWGNAGAAEFLMGRLRVGEAMSPPLMRQVKELLAKISGPDVDVIIDAPPGVSCPAVNATMDSDVIVLVTEPTPFGFHDFRLAHEAFSPFGKPMGVVVNRAGLGDDSVYEYCREHNLPILAEIPYARKIAEAYARGTLIADVDNDLRQKFVRLRENILRLVAGPKEEAAHA
ncbi:MAG: 4Fe-4S binding protein, partial [Desulfovibrionales bacterium]